MESENDTRDEDFEHNDQKRIMTIGCPEAKRLKWEAKQTRKEAELLKNHEREQWFARNSSFCTRLTLRDIEQVKNENSEQRLAKFLAPFINLKDGSKNIVEGENLFIAEGTDTVRVLIKGAAINGIKIKSILVKPATLFDPPVNLLEEIESLRQVLTDDEDQQFHVLVGEEKALSAIAGFQISRGALACGVVPTKNRDEMFLTTLLASSSTLHLLALDGICDTANMGSIIRCAAAFGIDAIILSHDCCDPWYRRSVRVSMGHIFHIPIIRVLDLATTIKLMELRNIISYAAVIDPDAELILEKLVKNEVPSSWCCVMGNEGSGISKKVAEACTTRLRISMVSGVDSLSVPIATGILLHGLIERTKRNK